MRKFLTLRTATTAATIILTATTTTTITLTTTNVNNDDKNNADNNNNNDDDDYEHELHEIFLSSGKNHLTRRFIVYEIFSGLNGSKMFLMNF